MLSFAYLAVSFALIQLSFVDALPQYQPGVGLPLVRRVNATGIPNILAQGRNRAKALSNRILHPKKHAVEKRYPTYNIFEEYPYTLMTYVNFGAKPGLVNMMIVDTTESITWTGAFRRYNSSTTKPTGRIQEIQYNDGAYYIGSEATDRVGFDQTVVIDNYTIGIAARTSGVTGNGAVLDGVLGLGPQSSSAGAIDEYPSATLPNLVDALYAKGKISNDVFSIFMPPHSATGMATGQLVLGGINYNYASAAMSMVPVTSAYPSSSFWGINQSISYGSSKTQIMPRTAGVFDSWSIYTFLPSDAFKKYTDQIGAKFDDSLQMWYITPTQYASLQSLYFEVGAGDDLEFTANAQILPRSLNTAIGGSANLVYLILADIGYPAGSGLDFINGQTFLERFYTSYDATNKVVGIAPTQYTYATPN